MIGYERASVNKLLYGVTDDNLIDLYDQIVSVLTMHFDRLVVSMEKWFDVIDEFTLEFNVNSREFVDQARPVMKKITDLSLGQKVAAILSFVFKFGHHVNDNTPLIIDQPEDNLDNQYIYKNLVSSLRDIKNSRQVIVVTHSSTIVTNADAEQVIVMGSDNEKGWVEKCGYPSDPIITKHIMNYLEGGIDSFKHKMTTYNTILPYQSDR
jgi:ATPase subunit of ABC transporter with duplicated ATPase domains